MRLRLVPETTNWNFFRYMKFWLGVSIADTPDGVSIVEIVSGSPADDAGLRVGDVITAVDSVDVETADALVDLIATYAPGDESRLFIIEKPGRIRILDLDSGSLNPGYFLDISSLVNGGTSANDERVTPEGHAQRKGEGADVDDQLEDAGHHGLLAVDALGGDANDVERTNRKRDSRRDELTALRQSVSAKTSAILPQAEFGHAIRRALPPEGIFVSEMTQIGYWSNFAFPVYQPNTYLTCGYQGTLGFGFPTALGAKVGEAAITGRAQTVQIPLDDLDRAGSVGHVERDRAEAAAVLRRVVADGRALRVAVRSHCAHGCVAPHDDHADDAVALPQSDSLHTLCHTTGRRHLRFREADRAPLLRDDDDVRRAVGELDVEQCVLRLQLDRADAARADVEIGRAHV